MAQEISSGNRGMYICSEKIVRAVQVYMERLGKFSELRMVECDNSVSGLVDHSTSSPAKSWIQLRANNLIHQKFIAETGKRAEGTSS
ncbi:MAG: hypothetical protein GY774_38430 [Planctomycetes bacterium]|nr:hypothetical protein [Planctomycetota bacterium]